MLQEPITLIHYSTLTDACDYEADKRHPATLDGHYVLHSIGVLVQNPSHFAGQKRIVGKATRPIPKIGQASFASVYPQIYRCSLSFIERGTEYSFSLNTDRPPARACLPPMVAVARQLAAS